MWDLIIRQVAYDSLGVHRPYAIGSRRTAVLINGRPIADFNIDLDAVPVTAIYRIEVLAGSDVAIRGPGATGGVVNIVLRNEFEGVEVVAGGEVAAGAAGDTGHTSVLWGGPAGAVHLTIDVDAFQRREVRSADRDFSRSTRTPGEFFADTVNASVFGNTAFVVDSDGNVTACLLGECTGDEFTGPRSESLDHDGAEFRLAYVNWGWVRERREQQALFLDYEAAAEGDERVYFETRLSEGTTHAPSYAPSYKILIYSKPEDCMDPDPPPDCVVEDNELYRKLAVAIDQEEFDTGLLPDAIVVRHHLVGHGERGSRETVKGYDATTGLRRSIASQANFVVHIRAYRHSDSDEGGNCISASRFEDAVVDGTYDLADPVGPDSAPGCGSRKSA